MASWNGVIIPEAPQTKIPNSIPQNFNWGSYMADPKGTFNKFKGAREVNRLNWKGYRTATTSAKRIILSSPSKKFISDAMKQVNSLRQARATAEKTAKITDKIIETGKGSDKISKATNIGKTITSAGSFLTKFGPLITLITSVGVGVLANEIQGWRADMAEQGQESLSKSISKIYGTLQTYKDRIENNKKAIAESKLQDQRTRDRIYSLEKERTSLESKITEAKKQANDALYETRQGKTSLESKIAEAKKQANDALYETRQGKTVIEGKVAEAKKQANDALYETRQNKFSLDAKIQQINSEIARISNKASDGFQNTVNASISKLQSELATVKFSLAAIKPATPTDVASITNNAIAAAKAETRVALLQVSALQSVVSGLAVQTSAALTLGGTAINGVSNLAQGVSSANITANQALAEAKNKGVPNLAPLQQQLDTKFNQFVSDNNKALGIKDLQLSDLSKEFDRKNADFERKSNLTSEQRFAEFRQENDKALGIKDLQLSNLSKEFDRKNADFERQSNLTSEQRFQEFQQENRASLGLLKSDLGALKADLGTTEVDIKQIDTKIKEQEKVNATAIPKLDQILGFLPLIPGRAADAIRPDIATLPQIEAAAAAGTCKTTQPGGCMSKALNDNAANINNNTNNKAGNILDAVNTGANAALLAGQQTILQRLGNQLPGGIGGKLSRFADWMHLDRVLNVMILGATVHNALMLSNDLGQTFVGIINNVLQLVGLKKEDGSTFDIGSVISSSIENLIKGAIGADNYTQLREGWAKANRIYQATNNVINSFLNLSQTILQASELIASHTGKIGNALKKGGVILENAYGWMNPQPKFNRVTQFLEGLQNGASTIQMVTQAPLDVINAVTESTTAATEFVKAVKEDDKPTNKAVPIPEPDELKTKEAESKVASQPFTFDFSDLFDGED